MKKIFSFFCLSILSSISGAQTYHPFPDSSASWSETNYTYTNNNDRYYDGWRFEISNDTIINGYKYSLLGFQNSTFHIHVDLFNSWNNSSQNFPINSPGNIIGAFREDSTRKVFFRALENDFHFTNNWGGEIIFPHDSDIIIYDFNLNMGDTVAWKNEGKVVIGIDSLQLLNGLYRKTYEFAGDGIQTLGSKWIEGVGSDNGFFGAYELSEFESWSRLSCFHFNDSLLYENISQNQESCDVAKILSDENFENDFNFSCYPNISSNFIHFKIEIQNSTDLTLSILDIYGNEIKKLKFLSSEISIPVTLFSNSGLYFCFVKQNNKVIARDKFEVIK